MEEEKMKDRTTEIYVKLSDLLEACKASEEAVAKCRDAAMQQTQTGRPEMLAQNVLAEEHFEREWCRWHYDIPNLIRSVADGSWRKEAEA